ncbi:PTS beta-glucoside transporter subunit IIABC, partial [Lactobacillus sp. XV13L]|nr:PTS beta-glucoside transporter subunit IIABC [Lactobacillus sp. XV13L]
MGKQIKMLAPVNGKVIPLSQVNDPIFSQKSLGDGFGIEPSNNQIKAPVAGKVVMIAKTQHAIGLKTKNGMEVLIHLGIDTVELEGQPFNITAKTGSTVKAGDLIGTMDLNQINQAGKLTTVIVAITNTTEILDKLVLNLGLVKAGDIAASVTLKAVNQSASKNTETDNSENKFHKTARLVIAAVGGKDNINSVIHCFTRLRFSLKDDTIPNDKEVNNLPGVIDVARANNQYQVVIGQTVDDVYDEVIAQLGSDFNQVEVSSSSESKTINEVHDDSLLGKIKNGFFQLIGIITGSMMPVIGLLAASGMLKGVLNILTNFGHMSTTSSTYVIINAMGDAAFYFLPLIVGFTAAQKLGANPVVVAIIGGFLIYPDLVKVYATGKFAYYLAGVGINANFFGIPIHIPQYTYSIFPMIFAAWMASKIEPWIKKWMPVTLRLIFTPLVEIFLVGMTVLVIIGPVISFISEGIATILQWLLTVNSALSGMIIGGLYQVLVIFGLHWAVIPLIANDIATHGHSVLN